MNIETFKHAYTEVSNIKFHPLDSKKSYLCVTLQVPAHTNL